MSDPAAVGLEFVLRFWVERNSGRSFWRGSAQEVENGEVVHMEDEETLVRFLRRRLIARAGMPLEPQSKSADPR